MKTFVSIFLEPAEITTPNNDQWKWVPAGDVKNVNCASFSASTTCCGCTRSYDGSTDVGADDNDKD